MNSFGGNGMKGNGTINDQGNILGDGIRDGWGKTPALEEKIAGLMATKMEGMGKILFGYY
jgi:hypothetical protein